jgi:phosphoglycolate phosphatase
MTSYAFDEPAARQAIDYYREYFGVTGIYENAVIPGVPELLAALRADGRQLCVVTSKPNFYAAQIVRHFDLDGVLDGVIGSEMDLSNSDKAVLVKLSLERYSAFDSRSMVMIGDREHDILGAHTNGIDSIGVTYGAGSREELTAAGPTAIVDTVEELGSALGL